MGGTRFMVQWEEHPSHLATRLGQLLEHQTLVDVTLMCNTHTLRVHRAVLAACSPYFETILQRQLGMHPLIVLKDMQFSVLKSLIEFMYCGETSVTEDNLGALLQAAKFFQVKGLSAMTKEALGLSPSTKSTINGDAARKAFVGRPKRVGMQQTFVTSGLKTLPASHASSSHTNASANELPILPTKTTFQTISKPITARPDTQQQADTAQLLLSLSGSEFPKQTFHTVSKNVRFQHNVSGSTVSIDSARSSSVEGNVKAKEVVGRIPVMASNGGKTTIAAAVAGAAATTTATTTVSQQSGQIIDHTSMGSVREDVLVTNPQSVYLAEGHRRRGRPVKRQMNMLFQERVMTDADAALHKEAEASRKALEMLRQEMSSETIESSVAASSNLTVPVTPAAVVPSPVSTSVSSISQMSNVAGEHVQKGLVKHSVQGGTKIQVQSIQTPIATTSRTVTASQNVSSLVTTKKMNTNVYKTTNNTVSSLAAKKNLHPVSSIPNVDISNSNSVSSICKVEEPEMSQAVYELSNETTQEPIKEESVEYQVGGESVEGEEGGRNANIVYQVADSNSASAGSVMSQYMEVLKEAGLPTDVPILLDSGDGSYVTVNEEVLMNIVNGGVLQCHVTEGNFVAGDGVEFIVQEITEDEMEAVQAQVQEQSGEGEPLPKEVENNSEATANAESLPSTTDVKLPVEEETQLVECTETQENKQVVSQEEISQPDDQAMEINSDLLPNNESVQQESQEPQNETVGLCPEETLIKEDIIPEETSEGTSDGNEQTETKYESDLQTVVSKDEDAFESEACSTELQNNENDQENVKNENNENEMSVEQALQAMMGESSDTELESCTNNDVQGTSKDESVVSGLETISQSLKEEKSDDLHLVLRSEEGTEEDLRLVLSNDAGDANDDSSYTLTIAPSTADEKDSLLPEGGEKNSDDQEDTVVTVLPTDTTQEIGVQECVTEAPIPTSNEFESVTEQSDEIEHVVEPLQVESVSKEVPSPLGCVSGDDTNIIPKMEEELEGGESTEYMESVPGSEVSGDSQEVSQLTSNTEASSAEAVCNSASEYSKPQGAIISPSKDIPYAVGLLPLKTALEKLQAMPEYHPRKTRSSSTGKESTPDMPAARVKRKASSSDGADKRLKLSAAEEGTIMEQPTAEEICDGDTTMEVVASSISEERNEETILSMPELMTEPTEG